MTKTAKEREDNAKKATIAALIRERRGYEMYGQDTSAVDAELKRLGANPKPPAKRATQLDKKKPDASL